MIMSEPEARGPEEHDVQRSADPRAERSRRIQVRIRLMSGTGRGNLRLEEVRAPNEVSFDSHRGARLQASFPRLMTPRRTKAAATARNGSMNSDTLAPNGMSPLRMPTVNA